MCSFSPDVDFSEIYKEKRFLVISMAGYPTQKLDYQVLSSLLVILMAHAAPTLPKNSIHPSMVFEHTFSSCPVSGKILDSFADTSSLFVCDCTPEGDDCTYFHQVFNMARVFLQLKSEDPFPLPFGHSVHNAGIRIHRRDIMSQRPGECIAWGGLLKFSSGKSKKIEGTCRIKLHNQHE
jgi:hypothetical protein